MEDNACTYQQFDKIRDKLQDCSPPQTDIRYEAFVTKDEFLAMKNPQPAIFVYIEPFSMMKTIKEEVRIYDDAALVASLGGFLGLFVGFSFHGTLCTVIDKLFSIFQDNCF